MFDTIVYLERVDNYKLNTNITFFLLNFENIFNIFIVVIYANANALVVFILKFVNIALKKD